MLKSNIKKVLKGASIAVSIFLLNILVLLPFLAGHSLHSYWESAGKVILLLAMGTFLVCVIKVAAIYASYQAARDTRREFRDID